jgi:2-methylisocitrate lyase-like PEP mutase family enzyme
MLRVVAAIASAVDVPVTADLEAGYGDVAGTVRLAIDAGAVGFNLEDGRADGTLMPLDEQLDCLAEARSAAGDAYMNARTDGVWLGLSPTDACTRARAYAQAGADGVFVPGAREPELLRELVEAVDGFATTINVLAVPGLPPVDELAQLGIARVSTGSGPARAALSVAHAAARELLDDGTYGASTSGTLSYAEVNTIMGG